MPWKLFCVSAISNDRPRARRPMAASAASPPAAKPSCSAFARPKTPRQAPAERSFCADWPGMKFCEASSHATVPRDCEKRCTDGVHPPDISTTSQRSASPGATSLADCSLPVRTPDTRKRPEDPTTVVAGAIARLSARAASTAAPSGRERRSAISAISTPALCRSIAAS